MFDYPRVAFFLFCLKLQTLTHYNLFEFFWFFFLGTTGDPKPILYLHQFLEIFLENRLANELLLNNNNSSSSSPPSQQLLCFAHLNQDIYFPCMFPISWSAALTSCTLSSLAWDVTCIYLPPDAPFDSHPMLTPEYVHDILELTPKGPKNGVIMAPAMLRDVVQQHQQQNSSSSSSATCTSSSSSSSLNLLQKSYNWIGYGGSPLDFATGEILRKSFSSSSSPIRLQCAMGQTDVGPYDILFNPNPADWNLVQFSELHGYFLVEFDQREGLWELCVRRQQPQAEKGGKGKEECRHPFLMDEKLEIYHTRDLFRAVRRKKEGGEVGGEEIFWQSAGRVDDFIKLSTLTKFHSGQIESILQTWCEEVHTCLVGGEGKIRPWVIVELRKTKKENEKENENVTTASPPPPESFWLAVDKANEILYSEAKIQKEFVVFTDEERPIQRTGKGSVDRKKTVGLYEREIEALYE